MHAVLVIAIVVAVVAFVVWRQLHGEALSGKRVVVLPLVLTVAGGIDLARDGSHPSSADIGFIVGSALLSAAIGLGQGAAMHLENRDGGLWGRMPAKGLWWWAALVGTHLLLDAAAKGAGADVAASTSPLLLVLGINRLAQAIAIAPRAVRAGVPFAPAKARTSLLDGLGGLGARSAGGQVAASPPAPTPPAEPASAPAPSTPPPSSEPTPLVPTPPVPTTQEQPQGTWQESGRFLASAIGDALQERRSQRGRGRGRRSSRRDRW